METGRIPGAVLGVVDRAGTRRMAALGLAQRVPDERAMREDTWFDLASLTKVVYTTPRLLALAEEGAFDLDGPLTQVLPDLRQYDAAAWERRVTFRQCLGHQTPFPAVEAIYTYGRDPDLLRAFVLQRLWTAGPAVYSDINFILLGIALERLTGVRRWREMPAGDGFDWSADPAVSAATEHCTWRHAVMCGSVHDENCAAFEGAGHAGLFGTAAPLLSYAAGLLDGSGVSPFVLATMRQPLSATRTHGWERRHTGWSGGDQAGPETLGHTGFTGTGLWIDFAAGHAWTLLTNRIHPTRHADSGILELRREVGGALRAS